MSDAQLLQPLQEGSRWRHAKPTSEEVADWFRSVPLDEGMQHENYVSGVVLIPASEKIKRTKPDGRGKEERFEDTFTPYVRVDTRVAYFHALAEAKGLVPVIEPVEVPTITEGPATNENMPAGFWWHLTGSDEGLSRWLCCTQRVALYRPDDWLNPEGLPSPLREGTATKQIAGAGDPNMLAKAETGAVGRALGMAGILVVGTGIATAEDMQELREPLAQGAPVLPEAGAEPEDSEALNARLRDLLERLIRYPQEYNTFVAWWDERAATAGWDGYADAPIEVRRGMAEKLENKLAELPQRASEVDA